MVVSHLRCSLLGMRQIQHIHGKRIKPTVDAWLSAIWDEADPAYSWLAQHAQCWCMVISHLRWERSSTFMVSTTTPVLMHGCQPFKMREIQHIHGKRNKPTIDAWLSVIWDEADPAYSWLAQQIQCWCIVVSHLRWGRSSIFMVSTTNSLMHGCQPFEMKEIKHIHD